MTAKPVLLLADSQLLFLKNDKKEYYLKSVFGEDLKQSASCAYLSASNNDEPEFYEMFTEAMDLIGLSNCKMISSAFNKEEQEYLEKADLILLAGGDVDKGLQVFKEKGIDEILQKRYQENAMFIGVSAGAVQLGWQFSKKESEQKNQVEEALKFVPFMVLVHSGKQNFQEVESLLKEPGVIKRAYEIPAGAGIIYHPDNTIEALRKPINEFIQKEEEFLHTLIYPQGEQEQSF